MRQVYTIHDAICEYQRVPIEEGSGDGLLGDDVCTVHHEASHKTKGATVTETHNTTCGSCFCELLGGQQTDRQIEEA